MGLHIDTLQILMPSFFSSAEILQRWTVDDLTMLRVTPPKLLGCTNQKGLGPDVVSVTVVDKRATSSHQRHHLFTINTPGQQHTDFGRWLWVASGRVTSVKRYPEHAVERLRLPPVFDALCLHLGISHRKPHHQRARVGNCQHFHQIYRVARSVFCGQV